MIFYWELLRYDVSISRNIIVHFLLTLVVLTYRQFTDRQLLLKRFLNLKFRFLKSNIFYAKRQRNPYTFAHKMKCSYYEIECYTSNIDDFFYKLNCQDLRNFLRKLLAKLHVTSHSFTNQNRIYKTILNLYNTSPKLTGFILVAWKRN